MYNKEETMQVNAEKRQTLREVVQRSMDVAESLQRLAGSITQFVTGIQAEPVPEFNPASLSESATGTLSMLIAAQSILGCLAEALGMQ